MASSFTIKVLQLLFLHLVAGNLLPGCDGFRRILHEPLFPIHWTPPPPPESSDSFPETPTPPAPFSSDSPPSQSGNMQTPNLPTSSQPSNQSSNSKKKIVIGVSVTLALLGVLYLSGFLLYRWRKRRAPPDARNLIGGEDEEMEVRQQAPPEFLYLGTIEPRERRSASESNVSPHRKLSSESELVVRHPSPVLQPLPPLIGPASVRRTASAAAALAASSDDDGFYTPNKSLASLTSESPSSPVSRRSLPESVGRKEPSAAVVSVDHSPRTRRTSPRMQLSNSNSSPTHINHAIHRTIQMPPRPSPPPPPPPPSLTAEKTRLAPLPPRPPQFQDAGKSPRQLLRPLQAEVTRIDHIPYPSAISNASSSCPQPVDRNSCPQPWTRRTSPRMQFSNSNSPPTHINQAIHTTIQMPPRPPPPPPPALTAEKTRRAPLPPRQPQFQDAGKSPRQLLRPLQAEATRIDHIPYPSAISNASSSCPQPVYVAEEHLDGDAKPRLKPLHWDKVRASSDRATVWDQLKSSSFQVNEDMIETLFVNNATNPPPKESGRRSVAPQFKQENRVLDPKKSQNIAILLRALNVTLEEVTEALLDGNPEQLGTELLETLVKMAPTKEEELILRDYNSDLSKLGPAERFLKSLLDIPFAFKRVDAMLYRANFESEVRYLMKSFETLKAACEDLSRSRLFLKLLEAVLRTGNRMNVGTNRGEAKAFKLDTLLKLADVKGTDGRTTLLHFVVQEIVRSEGLSSDTAPEDPPNKAKDEDFRKQGLKVLAGLSSELGNVKQAAGMDSDVLSGYVRKLEAGLEKVRSGLQLEKSCQQGLKFFDSMKVFLREAEGEIGLVKAEEKRTMSLVREVTEYFHGDAAKEEAHPLWIFMVVRDFLSVLDSVCREVGWLHERTVMGSAGSLRIPSSASLPVLHQHDARLQRNSDGGSLSS